MNDTDVFFNGVNLQGLLGAQLYNLDALDYPNYEIRQYKVARAERSVATSKEAIDKNIRVNFRINNCSRSQSELTLTVLKLQVYQVSGLLQLKTSTFDVQYRATCNEVNHRWVGRNLMIEMVFLCATPYGSANEATTVALGAITNPTESLTIQAISVPPIRPQITIFYSSITGGTGEQVTLRNATTNVGITIQNDFASGDVLFVDSRNLIVTLNGSPVDFSGAFPTFTTTLASIFNPEVFLTYVDSFTDRTATGNFTYRVEI